MLHLIKSLTDTFFNLLSEDPVRPHIPHTERLGKNKDVFVLRDETDKVQAITCVSYQEYVPDAATVLKVNFVKPSMLYNCLTATIVDCCW